MRHQEKEPGFSRFEMDFSQEAEPFRHALRRRVLAETGCAIALSDDELDGVNAAGGFDCTPARDPKHQD